MQIHITRVAALLLTATLCTTQLTLTDGNNAELNNRVSCSLALPAGKIAAQKSREAAAQAAASQSPSKPSGAVSQPPASSSGSSSASNSGTGSDNQSSSSAENELDSGLYWLAAIINAEACGESYNGKVAVGNVILARVASDEFPNSIYGVVFDKNYGVQFTPVSNGTIYNTPCEDCIQAARDCLAGVTAVSGCLYFCNPAISVSTWIIDNRPYVTTIGGHNFYA